jgi:hypothetical protein
MARDKVTAYLTPDLSESIKRLATVEKRSVSDIIEDLIGKSLANTGRDAEHAAIMARLDGLSRKLGVIEKAVETHFELSAHAARFTMSLAPNIPEQDRAALNARGGERFRNMITAIVSRLSAGKSVLSDALMQAAERRAAPAAPTSQSVAAE